MENTGNPGSSQQPPAGVFMAATVLFFFLSLSAADSIGFVPYYIDGSTPAHADVALDTLPELGEESNGTETNAPHIASAVTKPSRISIPAIGLDLPVSNPATRDIAALDVLLKKGPVRYVDSAKLGESGNMIIFAHSSNLPVVHNQMYRAFNDIPELKANDLITLTGEDGKDYLYSVLDVRTADVSDAVIDLSPKQGTKLTLVTCDTLTGKSARFILEAEFVGSY